MHVFQTDGAPPRSGKSIFAISGCTQNSRAALVKSASANRGTTEAARRTERLTPRSSSISVFISASRKLADVSETLLSARARESIITFSLSQLVFDEGQWPPTVLGDGILAMGF